MPWVSVPFPAPEVTNPSLRWVQGDPASLRSLRGRPVLIDFFDVSCINCLRALPYLKVWHERYAPHGLTILGIQSPEFEFGREEEPLRRELRRLDIRWPVALDPGLVAWRRFANRAWPGRYLLDARGDLRFHQFGEGSYQELEAAMQQLLMEAGSTIPLPALLEPLRGSDRPNAECLEVTPELYLGSTRGRWLLEDTLEEEPSARYHLPTRRAEGVPSLEGRWRILPEYLEYVGASAESGRLQLSYVAREVHLVMGPGEHDAGEVRLRVDGRAVPADSRGLDVAAGDEARVYLDGPRAYSSVLHPTVEAHILELQTSSDGWRGYSVAFVTGTVEGSP